jgi:hypothetical protein
MNTRICIYINTKKSLIPGVINFSEKNKTYKNYY